MKELILNNFGLVGGVIFIAFIFLLGIESVKESKWSEAMLWSMIITSGIGYIYIFESLGKWLLK